MRKAGRLFTALLAFLCLFSLVSCRAEKETKHLQSYQPPKKTTLGEPVRIDERTALTVQAFRLIAGPQNRKILIISYDWENASPDKLVAWQAYRITVKQNGSSLKPDLSGVQDRTKLVAENGPGDTLKGIEQGFVLQDLSPVEILLASTEKTILDAEGKPDLAYPVKLELDLAKP